MRPIPHRKKPRNIIRLFVGLFLILSLVISYQLFLRSPTKDVELIMVYGSEKRAWIDEVAPDFEAWWSMKYPDRSLKLDFTPLGSRESMLQIIRETVAPTIWSPASSLWIPLMNYLWNQQHSHDAVQNFTLIEGTHPLVQSPIVIGTWAKYASQNNITGFTSLHQLATQPNSDLRFAHTDPQLSNSGFLSVILEISTALGKPPDQITLTDLSNEAMLRWMIELESRVQFYIGSTGFLADSAVSEGPQTLNAFVLYENLIIDNNRYSGPVNRWNDILKAVYPEEGTLMNDHPFAILQGDWVTKEEKNAAQEFLAFLLSTEIQKKAMVYGFRPVNPELALDANIFNPENGVKQNIAVPIFNFLEIDANVLSRIPDVWLITKR
ncbi:MAG: extracellular solute-binding protein [Candidatus Heimdallarchaeota archaeon]